MSRRTWLVATLLVAGAACSRDWGDLVIVAEDECAGVAPPQGITLGESFAGSIAGLQLFRYPPSQVRATTTSLAPPHSLRAAC